LAGALLEAARERRARDRAGLRLDLIADRLLRPPVAPTGDAGQQPLEHDPVERIAIGEVAVGVQLDLAAAVHAPNTRALDRQDTSTERDLAPLVAVPVGRPRRIWLAPRADDVDDLLFHQLSEHAEADADRQREQPLLRRPDQLPECRLHALRQLAAGGLGGGDDLGGL
jgi:hypothetical protein